MYPGVEMIVIYLLRVSTSSLEPLPRIVSIRTIIILFYHDASKNYLNQYRNDTVFP